MKRKFMIFLSVVVGILIIIGISYAYFTSEFRQNSEGASVTVTTADLGGVSLEVEGTLQFEDLDILPGHKNISAIKVTGFGNNQVVTYNLIWKGTNSLTTPLNFYVYKTITKENPTITCMKTRSGNANYRKYFEECKEEGFENLGEEVASGEISQSEGETTVTLVPNEVIKGTEDGNTVYYYVVLEYPNLESEQNIDIGGTFDGLVTVEQAATSVADIKIAKIFKKIDGQYEETSKAPTKKEGYTLDTKSSTCDKSATITWDNATESIKINNIKEKEITCSFYYMESPSSVVLKSLGLKSKGDAGTITGPSCDESSNDCGQSGASNMKQVGVYETEDNDGVSYFYRGGVDNNWVKFGENDDGTQDVWWRIVRINGDGTIRLIYSGMYDHNSKPNDGVHETGPGTVVATGQAFNLGYKDNTYVGFYYGTEGETDFDKTHSNATPSKAVTLLTNWYNGSKWDANKYGKYIDEDAGFCNDRTKSEMGLHGSNFTQKGYGTEPTVYGPTHRLITSESTIYDTIQEPTLNCGELEPGKGVDANAYQRDLFTPQGSDKGNGRLELPVGLITSDEVAFAGGFGGAGNTGYYLYNNLYFWTMSPHFVGADSVANMSVVYDKGTLSSYNVNNIYPGIRPVINLKADTTFKTNGNGEKGTIDNPYVVEVQ